MIPIKLELKNFLSYGDPFVKIDFEGHNLICLSGKNGNGKSALLDAITWVLWGQARKISGTAKADAGLIRLGQTRMVVALEFFSNGQRYRVRREYEKKYGKPQAYLNIDMFSEASKTYRSLSEKTVRMTQEKIEKIVGLDFGTFVNSAFLRQGQSNEFSQKTPKERKQILANILGLSRYDELSRLSLDNMKHHNENRKVLQKVQEQVDEELKGEAACGDKLKSQKKELSAIEGLLGNTEKKLSESEKKKIKLFQKKYENEQIEKEVAGLKKIIEQKSAQFMEYAALWRKVHAVFLRTPDFESFEKERKNLLDKDRKYRDIQQKNIAVQEKIIAKRSAYLEELSKRKLEYEKSELSYKNLLNQIKQKEEKCNSNLEKQKKISYELETSKKELENYKKFQEDFDKIKDQFEKRRVFYKSLIDKGNWGREELKDLVGKRALVGDKKNPSCPLCEQVLTIKRKQFLARTFERQEKFLKSRLARITNLIKKLKLLLFEQHKQVQGLSFKSDRYKQLLANCQLLEKNLAELKADNKSDAVELNLLKVRENTDKSSLSVLKEKLTKQEKELKNLEKNKKDLNYDKKAHEEVTKLLVDCEKKLQEFRDISAQRAQQEERRKVISGLSSEIKGIKEKVNLLLSKQKKLSFDSNHEKTLEKKVIELKEQRAKSIKDKEKILQEIGRLESKKGRFSGLKKDRGAREKEIEGVAQQAKEYQVLAQVFGKDGIQALLIEQTIPEIEQEANTILSRLTDNKSQIFIESLRDLKRGGVKESLDIHISDTFGIRPYEMFSGGEAFRIDFALRIAISKLLARRAGTALQTLIIDEGFGSQDEEGLQRLMDAIYAIQKDFVKIIVVSHLPIFKNNFPVHFVVEKDSLGSFVRVEERG